MSSPKKRHEMSHQDEPRITAGIITHRADSVRRTSTSWLFCPHYAANGLHVLEGDPGRGKSTYLAWIVGILTRGDVYLTGKKIRAGNVLWMAGEEDPATMILPRLRAHGARLNRVHFALARPGIGKDPLTIPASMPSIIATVRTLSIRLIVIDPLISFLPVTTDPNSEIGVRQFVDSLSSMCHAEYVACIMVRHLRKDRSGSPLSWGIGSVGIGAGSRAVYRIDDDPSDQFSRIVYKVKHNTPVPCPDLRVSILKDPKGDRITRAEVIASDPTSVSMASEDIGTRDVYADARALLSSLLQSGPKSVATIIAEAGRAAISERTLRTAKADMRIVSKRITTTDPPSWEWSLLPE